MAAVFPPCSYLFRSVIRQNSGAASLTHQIPHSFTRLRVLSVEKPNGGGAETDQGPGKIKSTFKSTQVSLLQWPCVSTATGKPWQRVRLDRADVAVERSAPERELPERLTLFPVFFLVTLRAPPVTAPSLGSERGSVHFPLFRLCSFSFGERADPTILMLGFVYLL